MPVPAEYQRIRDHLYDFLLDARNVAELGSTHMAYTMVQGVLQTFRRRLSLKEAIRFAQALPAGLRALFVADWDPDEPVRPFADRETMNQEVQQLRPLHNFAPANAIECTAVALRRHVDSEKLDVALEALPEGARTFWAAPDAVQPIHPQLANP